MKNSPTSSEQTDPLHLYPNASGKVKPINEFGPFYKHLSAELRRILPEEKSPHLVMPYHTENPTEFLKEMNAAPTAQKVVSAGLFNSLHQTSQGKLLNEKEPYEHQNAIRTWLAQSLCQRSKFTQKFPTNFMVESGPGSGKTLILGDVANSVKNGQVNDYLHGSMVYVTHRDFFIRQQIVGKRKTMKDVLLQFTEEDAEVFAEVALQSVQDHTMINTTAKKMIPSMKWKKFISDNELGFSSYETALCAVKDFLEENKVKEQIEEHSKIGYAACCEALASLLSKEAIAVRSQDKKYRTASIYGNYDSISEENDSWKGDVGFAFANLHEKNEAYAQLDKHHETIQYSGVYLPQLKGIAIPNASFWGEAYSQPYRRVIANADVVIFDEANKYPGNIVQERVKHYANEAGVQREQKPLVFSASAERGTTDMKMPLYDMYSSGISISEGIEKGAVSPISFDLIKGKETMKNAVDKHFEEIPLFREKNQLQPWERDTIWITTMGAQGTAEAMLRNEYEKRYPEIEVEIVCYESNTAPALSKNLNAWMVDERATDGSNVRILVMQAGSASKALSWPTVGNITFATDRLINAQSFLGQLGRGLHSKQHLKDPNFSVLIRMQQFKNARTTKNGKQVHPLQFLDHQHPMDENGLYDWEPGAILKPLALYQADQKLIADKKLENKKIGGKPRENNNGSNGDTYKPPNPTGMSEEKFAAIREAARKASRNGSTFENDESVHDSLKELAPKDKAYCEEAKPLSLQYTKEERIDIMRRRIENNIPTFLKGDEDFFDNKNEDTEESDLDTMEPNENELKQLEDSE